MASEFFMVVSAINTEIFITFSTVVNSFCLFAIVVQGSHVCEIMTSEEIWNARAPSTE